jgi:hypothetical protein
MILALSAVGIGAVSSWSLYGFKLSSSNLLICLGAMLVLIVEARLVCHEISISILALTMISTLGIRYIIWILLRRRIPLQP